MTGIQPELWVERAAAAVEYYQAAFGARVLHQVGGGDDIVAQLAVGDAAFWVSPGGADGPRFSPGAIGGATGRTLLVADDPDALFARAVAAGATVASEMADEHGWRLGRIFDPFGHEWEIGRPGRGARRRADPDRQGGAVPRPRADLPADSGVLGRRGEGNLVNESYSYASREGAHPVSWDEFYAICAGLAIAVADYDPDCVAGIARGGIYPATQLSHLLRRPLVPVVLSRRVNDEVVHESPVWTVPPPASLAGKKVLVVDEICDSGETLRVVTARVAETALAVRTAVLYSHTRAIDVPDYVGLVSDELIVNPWDKAIVQDGKLVPHPEYVEALGHQRLGPAVLSDAVEPVRPGKTPGDTVA